jgi:hypothetical protein
MAFRRAMDGFDPLRPEPVGELAGDREIRPGAAPGLMAVGTLACPACDAPVSPGASALSPSEVIGCPFCAHSGAVRDFLSLAGPPRPARVAVRVRERQG